mmetsp:Transcript_120716/g.352556  ORF Transcript_120716/g.352556 Transcript_120716/m.352556 type:complete len:223 (-) Transcript_120716:220-888(-)
MLHHPLVEVLASQVRVTVRGDHLKHSVVNGQEGHVEGAPTQVVYQDVLLRLLVKAVRNGSGCRLIDDAQNIHAGNGARILCGLPLGIVEVCRHGDDCVLDLFPQIILGSLLHLREDHGGHLFGCHNLFLALYLNTDHWLPILVCNEEWQQLDVLLHCGVFESAANQALDIKQRLRGIHSCLVLRRLTYQPLLVREGNIGWRNPVALIIWENVNPAVFVYAHA